MIRLLRWSFLIAGFLAAGTLHAQMCQGWIRILVASGEGRADTAHFVVDTTTRDESGSYFGRVRSADGIFDITGRSLTEGGRWNGERRFMVLRNEPPVRFKTGCGGDFELVIRRHAIARDEGSKSDTHDVADSMTVRLMNACDATLGIVLHYEPGLFAVEVCDTTTVSADGETLTGYRYRSLYTHHPRTFPYGEVYDLTAALRRIDDDLSLPLDGTDTDE